MYKRFQWDTEINSRLDDSDYIQKLQDKKIPDGSKVFVCSTIELFHPLIEKKWRDDIFSIIETNPKITFQILTKMPQYITREMPDNVWLGTSITEKRDFGKRLPGLYKAKARVKFISFEPLLAKNMDAFRYQGWLGGKVNWIVLGRLTGHGKKQDPSLQMIQNMTAYARSENIPIFLKHNLKDIWPGELIQEWPE